MDSVDAGIVNHLQEGLPVCARPFDDVAATLGLSVDELLSRVQRLLDDKVLTRFGPMYNAENMGGALSLCARPSAQYVVCDCHGASGTGRGRDQADRADNRMSGLRYAEAGRILYRPEAGRVGECDDGKFASIEHGTARQPDTG